MALCAVHPLSPSCCIDSAGAKKNVSTFFAALARCYLPRRPPRSSSSLGPGSSNSVSSDPFIATMIEPQPKDPIKDGASSVAVGSARSEVVKLSNQAAAHLSLRWRSSSLTAKLPLWFSLSRTSPHRTEQNGPTLACTQTDTQSPRHIVAVRAVCLRDWSAEPHPVLLTPPSLRAHSR